MFKKRYSTTNKGKKYMTDRRKDGIKIARFVMVLVALIITPALASFVYTLNYNVISTAHAQVPEVDKELPMREWVMNEVKENGIDEFKVWALINCESRWNDQATNINNKGLGVDRGLWQINSRFQPQVSGSCSYDYKCSTHAAIKIIKKQGFKPWTCAKKLGL